MTFAWHCRECNSRGEGGVAVDDDKFHTCLYECEGSFLKALCLFVKRTIHKDCDGDIGVRAL
jgi:hypothetical protein